MGGGRQEEVLILIGISAALAFIFIATRLCLRYSGRSFGWDDYLIVVASVLLVGEITAVWKYVLLSGTGYHAEDLPQRTVSEQVTVLKWHFTIQVFYHPLMGIVRASIIMFLFRVHDCRRRIRYSLHVVFWANVFYTVATTFGNVFQCNPVRYYWEKPAIDHEDSSGNAARGGTCLGTGTSILNSALNVVVDLIIIPIPSIMASTLQLTLRTKVLVSLVMALCSIAILSSVGRLVVYYYRWTSETMDSTWNIGIAIIVAEPCLHIMAACAPTFGRLLRPSVTSIVTERTSICYEEEKPAPTVKTSKLVSKASHGTLNFHFGLSEKDDKDTFASKTEIESGKGETIQGRKEEDFQPLASRSTRAYVGGHTGAPRKKKKKSMEAPKSPRTSCSRTMYEEMDEDEAQAEPEHFLARGLYS